MTLDVRKSYAALTVIFAVALLCLLVIAVVKSSRKVELRLSSGQPGGQYIPVAESIARLVAQEAPEIELELLESDGSAQNASRLAKGECQLAILQNDTPGNDSIRSLVPLQTGALHSCAAEIRPLGPGPPKVGPVQPRAAEVRLAEVGLPQVSATQVRPFKIGLFQVSTGETSPIQVRPFHLRPTEACSFHLRPAEERPSHLRLAEVCPFQFRISKIQAGEVGLEQVGTCQVFAGQDRFGQGA